MSELPSGTVTLLFTDIEGSTRLLQQLGDAYPALLATHQRLVRGAIERHRGVEVSTAGDGFFIAFESPDEAVAAAEDAQRSLADHAWPDGSEVRVRMGIHTGRPQLIACNYAGLDVHRAARVMSAAHGGQVLVSHATQKCLDSPDRVLDLGEHRLKDLLQPERLYQLRISGLPRDFPPPKTIGNRPTNLPVLPTPLIGRHEELAEITQLLVAGGVRLLTLTGAGGTGKTRLALQAAAELLDDFSGGVFFVPFAPIRDSELVLATIARTLAVRELGGEPIGETLSRYLEERELLLVIDNFEQVIEAAPRLSALLARAPALRMLVTSRERLQLAGERVFEVEPLPLPASDDLHVLGKNDAVSLFLARAVALKRDFMLTEENARAIREICMRVDGLPLAIELAAARTSSVPPETLLERLDQRLKLLTGGTRDTDERQRTLRKTIEWSYDLLDPDAQDLFARLSCFVGGCTLEAAEGICDADLDALDGLVRQSLLRSSPSASGPRFTMLETIREYAADRLRASGAESEWRARHSRWFLSWADEAGRGLSSEEQAWLARIADDHNNVRAALAWLVQHDPEGALRLVSALRLFWYVRGHASEGCSWAEQALARGRSSAEVEAKALMTLGTLLDHLGDLPRAEETLARALARSIDAGDDQLTARTLNNLATVVAMRGDVDRARALYRRSIEIKRRLGDSLGVVYTLANLAGLTAKQAESLDEARELHEEAVRHARELKLEVVTANVLSSLAEVDLLEGDAEAARERANEALELRRKLGDKGGIANDLVVLGRAARAAGDIEAAANALAESLAVAGEVEDQEGIAAALEGIADVAVAVGDPERAVLLRSGAGAVRARISAPLFPADLVWADETLARARDALGEKAFEDAERRGRVLGLDEAVALASSDRQWFARMM